MNDTFDWWGRSLTAQLVVLFLSSLPFKYMLAAGKSSRQQDMGLSLYVTPLLLLLYSDGSILSIILVQWEKITFDVVVKQGG